TPESYLAGLELRASMIWLGDLLQQPIDHDVTQALVMFCGYTAPPSIKNRQDQCCRPQY
ncbi:transposase, partial [Streptomyces azureus]